MPKEWMLLTAWLVTGFPSRCPAFSGLKKLIARTPKAVFEANTVGEPAYTIGQRLFCLVVKFGEYSLAGIVCGIIGHAMAEGLMKVK